MSQNTILNSGHPPGNTCLAFTRDGSHIYTGGCDEIVRIVRTDQGSEQETAASYEANKPITSVAVAPDCWFSGSEDSEVRRFPLGQLESEGLVTSVHGVAIRCVALNPGCTRIAVTSDETAVKVINIEDTTDISLLKGHSNAVRKATWHPSGTLLTTCGADGKIIVWDVSEAEPKEVQTIEGIIPVVANPESPEFSHDCSAVWHPSGEYFFVATRAHELITISRANWSKSSTFSDDASSGAITALALSVNGVYLASSSQSGIFIWSTQTRRMLFRYQGALTSPIPQMAFSPTKNMLAWVNLDGVLNRWVEPIPSSSPDPVRTSASASNTTAKVKRKATPTLFDDVLDGAKDKADVDLDEDIGVDLDNDDWILDDLGGGMEDDGEAKRWAGKDGVMEMVSVTKAQPAFQPGATPMQNKKRYLTYNMIGVIEVTDQDTHHIVNVEFHDRSARKSYHFTDHFKYNVASLGERGAVYACQPENDHLAQVIYKPYGTWAAQGEWTYELPKGTKVLGVAAGGPAPTKSLREKTDADFQGNGNVVIATSEGELIFLTGTGIERCCLSLQGDFVSMVAGTEWVFVVHRDGATTMDGSQNLTGRLYKFDNFCLLQKDSLPLPKKHVLKWIGITDEGAPAIYDSAGVLNILPRFRLPFAASWTRVLNTELLERREGKQESYWPVGVSGDTFMCLILKGRQEYPEFPRPLIQELPLRLPFHRTDAQEAPLEEHLARETLLLDMLRDGLGDELTTDDISRRELLLDKELIQLIQLACKADRLARALDLARLLHHTASFDMAIKVAGFYHLIGLQEKLEVLKDDREQSDRLGDAQEQRRQRTQDFAAVPAPRTHAYAEPPRPKAFQDFRPPPAMHRPGLERATPAVDSFRAAAGSSKQGMSSQATIGSTAVGSTFGEDSIDVDYSVSSPDGKRKRADEMEHARDKPEPDNPAKRRAVQALAVPQPRANPFARKAGTESGKNPFTKSSDTSKPIRKSDSFFTKVDAAEADGASRAGAAKGKAKESKGHQLTLPFGRSSVPPAEKKAPMRKKKPVLGEKFTVTADKTDNNLKVVSSETQVTDIVMSESSETLVDAQTTDIDPPQDNSHEEPSTQRDEETEETAIEWAPSPPRQRIAT